MIRLLFFTLLSILCLEGNTQNVGIGTTNPGYKFQVNNSPLLDTTFVGITNKTTGGNFGDGFLLGVTGKSAIVANLENGNLRLGTNNQTRLGIDSAGNVGIGSFIPGFPKYKLDVDGDINTTGLIRLNGDPGTAGQVLGSNGTAADPSWVTTSYSNDTRFCVDMFRSDAANNVSGYVTLGGTLPIIQTIYNLNTTNVTVGANTITINKSGLYHLEAFYSSEFNYTSSTINPSILSYLNIGGTFVHDIAYNIPMNKGIINNTSFYYNGKCSLDIYITAPKSISLYSAITKNGVSTVTEQAGKLYGHLISE